MLLVKVSLLYVSYNYHCLHTIKYYRSPIPQLSFTFHLHPTSKITDETSIILMPLHIKGYHPPLTTSNQMSIAIRTIGNPISQSSPESLDVRSTLGTNCLRGQVVRCGHETRCGGLFLQEVRRSPTRDGHYNREARTAYVRGWRMKGSDEA